MSEKFVHLRAHSEYSFSESILRIEDLVRMAKEDGMPAVAIGDPNGMFGAIRFYSAAKNAGLKPIIGCDVNIEPVEEGAAPTKVLLLCKTEQGYRNLMSLLSDAYSKNLVKGEPQIPLSWFQGRTAGIVCLSGDENQAIGKMVCEGKNEQAAQLAGKFNELFPDGYFLEVQRRGGPQEEAFVQGVSDLAQTANLPLVATHPMLFAKKDDYVAHEVKVCDKRKEILDDRNRSRDYTPEQHFKTDVQMRELFSDFPDAVDNAVALAKACSLSIPLGKSFLPDFQTPDGSKLSDYFAKLSRAGLEKRLEKLYPNHKEREQKRPEYEQRLEYEIGVIDQMGFEGYFMIVADFIQWAKNADIPVGPGRGSGAGSLVAYSLQITDLDPLQYGLLFERFLNPDRVSMPDFDIDFCQLNRQLVINYVSEKYGSEAVSGICAIGTLGAKNALRATGRALGMHYSFVEGVSKLIPSEPGKEVTLEKSLEDVPQLMERYETEPECKRLVDYAKRLEGLPNNITQHAAGVVISPGKISDFSPLYVVEGKDQPVSQFDKDDVEKAGLVKFDFLGLTTLSEIEYAVKLIKQTEEHKDFDITSIPLDDPMTLDVFSKGDTISVFQFESQGMRGLLKDAKVDRFEDLHALTSLFRPGPSNLIPTYLKTKSGQTPLVFEDPRLEPILKETYGVMIYQEQVMQIAQTLAGYTLGQADLLRRAMGKKKAEEMAKHRKIFVEGATARGVAPATAEDLFTKMEKFAEYGFNKSHAAAYSLVSYRTAYLKAHFPAAFYSAMLTIEGDKEASNIPPLIEDASKRGIRILPPEINSSLASFVPVKGDDRALSYGLSGIKGLGGEAAQFIVNTRDEKGDFENLLDFVVKTSNSGIINKKGIEVLIKSGAFDKMHPNRAESLDVLPKYLKYVKALNERAEFKPEDDMALGELFGSEGKASAANKKRKSKKNEPLVEPEWPTLPEQPLLERLSDEENAFGFWFSGHPFTDYKKRLGGAQGVTPLAEIDLLPPEDQSTHYVAGIISDIRVIKARNGTMAVVKLSDDTGDHEVTVFATLYDTIKDLLKKGQFLMFSADAAFDSYRKEGIQLKASQAYDYDTALAMMVEKIQISAPKEDIDKIKELCAAYPGDAELVVWHPFNDTHVKSAEKGLKVKPSAELVDALNKAYTPKFVKCAFRSEMAPPPRAQAKRKAWKKP